MTALRAHSARGRSGAASLELALSREVIYRLVRRCLSSLVPSCDAFFLAQAMKRGLDCFNLDCLQSEPASEVMRVQESIMGVPRSVGDFFT